MIDVALTASWTNQGILQVHTYLYCPRPASMDLMSGTVSVPAAVQRTARGTYMHVGGDERARGPSGSEPVQDLITEGSKVSNWFRHGVAGRAGMAPGNLEGSKSRQSPATPPTPSGRLHNLPTFAEK